MTTASPINLDDGLTDRQLRFVYEYLLDLNASAAAVRAGYAASSRASQAHELMNNLAVRDRIRVELRSLLAEAGCSSLDLMKQRMKAAFFRADKLLGKGWEMLPSEEVEAETLAALQVSGSFGARGPVVRVKQPDRDKALRALERVHERLEDKSERYYAQLAREGKLPSLEEIEAMGEVDGEGDAQVDAEVNAQMDVRKETGGPAPAEAGAACENAAKTMVLSGSPAEGEGAGARFPGKTQVLSGGRLEAATRFREKPWVLSGCGPGGAMPAAIFPRRSMVFSGCAAGQGAGREVGPEVRRDVRPEPSRDIKREAGHAVACP